MFGVLPVTNYPPTTPQDNNPAANTVVEGAAVNTLVGITAFSTDDQTVTYSLGGDSSGGGFKINASTGVVSVADPSKINFETASHSYIITVNASDGFSVSSQNFTIAVTDVAPSTPVDSNASANQVNEGASFGSPVGITASSTDINGPGVTWSLTGDSSGGGFTINATTGVITVADSTKIDYETSAGHAYTVTAQASDGTLTSSQNFTINVIDVDMPVPVDTNAAANTVAEGAAAGTTVGVTVSSVDRNGPATTYSLLGDSSGGGFTINPSTGVVTVADPSKIDFESSTGHAYKIVVLASSSGGNITQQFTIGVTDVAPSTPTDSDAATNAVVEGAVVGSPVGITAHSTDVNGPGVTWSLTGDTSGGGFKINPTTGTITVVDGSKIDYETSPGHAYNVTATATDGTLSSSQTYSINVIDFDVTVPADSDAAANTVAEGAAVGSTVGVTASAFERNGPGPTYSLLGDSSGGGFTINPTTGVVTVADPSKIDFETSPGHVYKIVVLADSGDRTTAQFTIGVTNVAPSTPTDSNAATNTVAEGAANGSTVGITASSADPAGPAVTWSLIGDTSGGGFTINASTGVITVADSTKIDYETSAGHAYTVTAQASDGTLTSSQTFTIAVTNVAPSTPVDSNAGTNTVAEGAANGSTVGVTASSTEANGPAVTYSLIGDSSGGGFTINSTTGVVTVADATKIDYETAAGHAYTVTAQASDGVLTSSQTFTIAVTDVAPSTPTDSNAAANTIAEGAANGSTVGVTASSTDVNGPAVTWSLTGDTSGGGFTIDASTGVVTVADSTKIDYETAAGHAYTVTAQASDGTLTSSQTFTIAVSDIAPSTPVDGDAAANTVAEGAANGSTVGVTASSTDVNGPAVTYSLIGDSSGGGFTINSTTGVVTVADATKIDFETSGGSYTVTAQASDGTLTSSQTFSIAVTNVAPSTPVDSDAAANTIAEGAANGSTVGVTASSTEANGPAVTYSLIGDTSGGGFTINSSTGVVTVVDSTKIDYETAAGHAYTVTAQASDGTLTSSQTFTIAVSDIAPSTPVDGDAAANTVAEGAANGSTVGVTASSSDVNGPAVTYSLTGDSSGGGFTINSTTGVVTVADATKIDFETSGGSYTVTAQASDGTLTSSQTFTIAVSDIAPSTPTDSDAAANTVAEGAANGSTVGVTASSTDVNGPAVTYSLIGDTSGGGFTINASTGVITVADSTKIDYETSAGHAYTVTAQASDGTLTSSQTFTIAVSDVASSTPVDSDAGTNTVAEGAANGSTVGVTASSADVNGPAVTYSLIGDTSGGGFTINSATGVVTIADTTKIDFESSGGSYTVTAQASDGTLTSSQTFTIAVTDVAPSTPTDSDAAANTIAEGAANGSTVGVTASSSDVNGPAVTWSLTGDTSGGGFTIDASTGVVTVVDSTKIDYETAAGHAYTVTAQASDGTLTSSQTFTIAVTDVTPSTPTDSDVAANTIAEGAANGSTVGVTASSTDVNGPAVTYSLTGDTSGGGFTINSTTGVVTVADATKIDFETSGGSYTVTAQASDGTLTSSQTFTIAVSDIAPSTPTDSDAAANTVVQGAAVGTYSGVTASSTDVNGPAVTYSLVGDTSGGGFTINPATGAVTVADSSKIIFTTTPTTYDVTVDSSDGTLHSQQTFSINVDPNAAPVIDSDGSGATAAKSVAENQTAVTTVHATDPDNGPVTPIAYSIVGGDDQAKFAINSTTGVLTFITAPDFENPTDTSTAGNNTYIVTVQASDGAAIDQQTITVTVTDVNDAPVITSNGGLATASINVNENISAVTTVTSTDQDSPAQTLTYSLAGGADQAKFSINSSTGVLTFNTAPNFEAPTDVGGDNGYDVIVRVTDNGAPNLHDDQAITVHVQDVNEAPDTGTATVTGNEDAASIAITLTGTDVDAGDHVASFHITNVPNTGTQGTLYSDAGLATQVTEGSDVTASGNAATVYFVPNANFNTHAGAVTFNAAATDTHGLTDATPATETINVTAVNDAPVNNGVPSSFTVQSGFNHVITGLSIADVDANEVGTPSDITTTFTAGAGTVSIGNGTSGGTAGIAGGATITTNGSGTVVLTGSVAQINTTLSGSNVAYNAADSAGNGSSSTTLQMATNDHGHNGSGGAITDTDTINVGVIPQVWFINQDQSSLDATAVRGSQTNPFSTVDEFNASSGPGTNDYIYVKAGTYNGEGINLKAGQILLGDDQALSFANPLGGAAIVVETASGARPTINVTAAHATDQGIALASNNTVAGIVVTTNAAGQVGIDDSGASVGTLNISDTDVTGGGQAINLTHGGTGGSVALGTVSSSGGTTGIALGGALATNFSATSGTLSGHSTSEITISGGSGTVSVGSTIGDGSGLSASITGRTAGTVTLSGNINDGVDTGGGIGVSNNTGGIIDFTGTTKTLNTGIGDGVSMSNNSGTTVNFTGGGLDIDTTAGTGFSASVAGTYTVTGTGNTINTTTGTALNLSHVTVGAGGITFASATTTGAATAISIDTVTGGAVNVNGGSIAGATANGAFINAASNNISIASSIASTAAGHSVQVTNSGVAAGNTILFSGAITDPGLGINLDNNDQGGAATINFTGALNVEFDNSYRLQCYQWRHRQRHQRRQQPQHHHRHRTQRRQHHHRFERSDIPRHLGQWCRQRHRAEHNGIKRSSDCHRQRQRGSWR